MKFQKTIRFKAVPKSGLFSKAFLVKLLSLIGKFVFIQAIGSAFEENSFPPCGKLKEK